MVMNLIAEVRCIDRYIVGELFGIGLFVGGPIIVGGAEGIIILIAGFIFGAAMDVMSQ